MKLVITMVVLFMGYLYGQPANDPCLRVCTLIYSPVCGSDNNTYPNACFMGYAACSQNTTITVQAEGVCEQEADVEPAEGTEETPEEEPTETPEEETPEEEPTETPEEETPEEEPTETPEEAPEEEAEETEEEE